MILTPLTASAMAWLTAAWRSLRWVALFAGFTVLQACGGGTGGGAGATLFPGSQGPSSPGTLSLSIAPERPIRVSDGVTLLSATLTDGGGRPVQGKIVKFESVDGHLQFDAASAVTNASGVAAIGLRPSSPTINAADTVRASVTVSGQEIRAERNVEVLSESPTLQLFFTTSSVATRDTPAQLRAIARDSAGRPVANTIVEFSTAQSSGAFSVNRVATNSSGEASVSVRPANDTTAGAERVIASAEVNGRTLTATGTVTFVATAISTTTQVIPSLSVSISGSTISSGTPATVTATLRDAAGNGIAGSVVTFEVVRGLARTNVPTALTDVNGQARAVLTPSAPGNAGADEITASVNVAGTTLQSARGFSINATTVTAAFDPLPNGFQLSEYGRVSLNLAVAGASVGSPVNISLSSSCASQGKASISPSTITATTAAVPVQYTDGGCGALQSSDEIQATVAGAASTARLTIPLTRPGVSSLAFVRAVPELIYLKGSGLGESSVLTFEVRDASGNPLGNQAVRLALLTGAGGVRMEGLDVGQPFDATSNAQGQVSVRVNAGTVPTPVRVSASIDLGASGVVSTVSSNLSIGVGLPSQLNFSLAQGTLNIEGFNIDGVTNTYTVIASDRNGNPVPAGTTINFVAEGGQIQSSRQIQIGDNGLAGTTASFQSSSPRPADGRVTITAYALGEESFVDLNGNNAFDPGEPFQDLGDLFKDRNFDGVFDPAFDETIPLTQGGGTSACASAAPAYAALLGLSPAVPSRGGSSCDGGWSGAGRVYVRRAVETVLSMSSATLLWASTGSGTIGLNAACPAPVTRQSGPNSGTNASFVPVSGATWFGGSVDNTGASVRVSSGAMSFVVADANTNRWNPMPAGTTLTASTPTEGLTVNLVGSPVGSTTELTTAALTYGFAATSPDTGVINIEIKSPRGVITAYSIGVSKLPRTTSCPN